jgi:non-ribosomal peptide synthetase component F
MDASLAEDLSQRVGIVWNLYGPTESTVWSTAGPVTAATLAKMACLPTLCGVLVGAPLPNQSVYVVDQELRILPRGCVGELIVAGAGVARYLGQTDDGKFFSFEQIGDRLWSMEASSGSKAFRTGDAAVMLLDGEISLLGRLDGQARLLLCVCVGWMSNLCLCLLYSTVRSV